MASKQASVELFLDAQRRESIASWRDRGGGRARSEVCRGGSGRGLRWEGREGSAQPPIRAEGAAARSSAVGGRRRRVGR